MLYQFQVYSKVVHIFIFFFRFFFRCRLLQDIEYSSLCYTAGYHCLSTLVRIYQTQTPSPSHSLPLGNHKCVLHICESVSFSVDRFICAIYQIPHISDIIWYLSFFFFFCFLGPHLQHIEVLQLGSNQIYSCWPIPQQHRIRALSSTYTTTPDP